MMKPQLSRTLILAVVVGSLALLTAGCGASEPSQSEVGTEAPLVLSGFDGGRLEVMRGIGSKLVSNTLISEAELRAAPPPPQDEDGSSGQQKGNDVWLTLVSDAPADAILQAKARWEASLILAAFWRRLVAKGDSGLRGGNVVFTRPLAEDKGVSTFEYRFAPDASSYLFTDASGKPSPLTANEQALEEAILSEAEVMGLVVDSLDFSGVEGTAVSMDATANDAITFVQTYGRTYGNLFGDPGLLEGIFLVVRDADGNLVKTASWSTGLQGGEGGLSEQYAQYDDLCC